MQRFEFNALYVLETDGFLIDKIVGRWNDEYAFLTFASTTACTTAARATATATRAVYPGSASDINTRQGPRAGRALRRRDPQLPRAPQRAGVLGHRRQLGAARTTTRSTTTAPGIVTDSIFPNHPGLPQDHACFENNRIFSNNRNYVQLRADGTCDRPFIERGYEHGIVCPVIPAPIGSGLVIAGGNYNKVAEQQHLRQLAHGRRSSSTCRRHPRGARPRQAIRHVPLQPLPPQPHGLRPSAAHCSPTARLLVGRPGRGQLLARQRRQARAPVTTGTAMHPPGGCRPARERLHRRPDRTRSRLGTMAPCATYDRSER